MSYYNDIDSIGYYSALNPQKSDDCECGGDYYTFLNDRVYCEMCLEDYLEEERKNEEKA